jgi:TonB family protein
MLDCPFMARNSKRLLLWRLPILALASLAASTLSLAQDSTPLVLPQSDIRLLANRILKNAGKVDCKPGACKILVANFALPSGDTSALGLQLSDAFAKELVLLQTDFQILDRAQFLSFLQRERISTKFLNNDDAIRWLAKRVGATAVVRGMTEDWGDSIRLRVTLLAADKEKEARMEEFTFPSSAELKEALSPIEAFPKNFSSADPTIPLIAQAGVNGAKPPICKYCPEPEYSDAARKVKFEGTVLLQIVVAADGGVLSAEVVRGLPYGLSDQALRSIREWRFQPAMRGNEPVTCRVMVDVTFHTYH